VIYRLKYLTEKTHIVSLTFTTNTTVKNMCTYYTLNNCATVQFRHTIWVTGGGGGEVVEGAQQS